MFIERGFEWCKDSGFNSMVTMQSWMFLSSYEAMREKLLQDRSILALIQIGYNSFPEINSKVAQACGFSILKTNIKSIKGTYINLNNAPQAADKNKVFLSRTSQIVFDRVHEDFKKIPGSPVVYWISSKCREIFNLCSNLGSFSATRKGMATGLNEEFVRCWFEVNNNKVGFNLSRQDATVSQKKWFPYANGGEYRKWYGNYIDVVNWENDGYRLQTEKHDKDDRVRAVNLSL